ncbi:hypothetical protein E1262_13735 [Jiangella aurantiaca]|uniref:Galactosyl transferase GMA12/MNN10 family protein n=1 Tax=Jiangella aurantiaca TaxID=2530373 RepID=A0A4R5AE24_9ACTN|nr:hypothetical protein [Jiangella aurantiaca]TDD69084.1 hypothetical protein E1262_13735 [Jiangella aurantiaca]
MAGTVTGRRVIVTAAGPGMWPVLEECALPSFHRYAARWGFDVHVVRLPADGTAADAAAQRAKWAKITLLRAALERYDLALWLDADVLVLRDDEDIAGHLHADAFQALVLEQVPYEHRLNPNTGVWLLRAGPAATALLDAVEAAGPQPGPWADQGAVLLALGWNRGDERYYWARPGRGTPFLDGTSWLPPSWNQPYIAGRTPAESFNSAADSYADRPTVPRPHALHFMGMTPEARLRHMRAAAAAAGAGQASESGDETTRRSRRAGNSAGTSSAAVRAKTTG